MERYSCGRQALGKFADLYGKTTFFQLKRYDELIRTFRRRYKSKFCYLASSSGRVELIGNHTDHNGGKVIGCTVDLDIVAAFLPNDKGEVVVSGNNYRDIVFNIADVEQKESGSIGMVKGVLAGLKHRGKNIGGFYACLNTTVPSGAGVSSSAAFQLLCAVIQNHLYNNGEISAQTMAEVGQYAENVYFNKPCGLLDQGVIAVGGVVQLDFKNGFEAKKLDDNLHNLALVVVDTGKSHSQLTEHYAAIPAEMKAVAAHFGKDRLADVDGTLFFNNYRRVESFVGVRPALRAKHFFEENLLVEAVSDALASGDKNAILQAVNKSGDSSINQLQNCSVGDDTTITDAVMYARSVCPKCASRVHGGGFAGTVLVVADKKDASRLADAMAKKYGKSAVRLLRVRRVGATVL